MDSSAHKRKRPRKKQPVYVLPSADFGMERIDLIRAFPGYNEEKSQFAPQSRYTLKPWAKETSQAVISRVRQGFSAIKEEFADSAEGDLNRYSPLDMEKMRVLMGACLGHDKIPEEFDDEVLARYSLWKSAMNRRRKEIAKLKKKERQQNEVMEYMQKKKKRRSEDM